MNKYTTATIGPLSFPSRLLGIMLKPGRFFVSESLAGRLMDFILNESVRPPDADGIDFPVTAQPEEQRLSEISALLIVSAGFQLDLRAIGQLEILCTHERRAQREIRRIGFIAIEHQRAISLNPCEVSAAVAIEVCSRERGCIRVD
jgi:hypothetical protein